MGWAVEKRTQLLLGMTVAFQKSQKWRKDYSALNRFGKHSVPTLPDQNHLLKHENVNWQFILRQSIEKKVN